jgi:hypothetical protein
MQNAYNKAAKEYAVCGLVFIWKNKKEEKEKIRVNKNRGERKTEEAEDKLKKEE